MKTSIVGPLKSLYGVLAALASLAASSSVSFASTINPEDWVVVENKPSPTLENLTIPSNAASRGMWSRVYDWPMNGLHVTVLADGRVFSFGTNPNGRNQDGRWYDLWDPSLGMGDGAHNTVYDPNRQNSFCSATTFLSDGNLLISGGNGETTSTLYNPVSHSSSTDSATMAEDRWYPTMINLADGRPIIMGGMVPYTEEMADDPELAIAQGWPSMTPEVYENGAWRSLFGAYSRDAFGPDFLRASYPRAWVAPNGLVFGISADKMWYLDPDANGGNGAITDVWNFKRGYNRDNPVNVGALSTGAMFAPGQVLQVGGNGGHNADKLPASNMATVIDFRDGAPQLREQPPMTHPRRYANAVVLANGQVVVSGGATYGNNYFLEPGRAVYQAEIWDPVTGKWSLGASANRIRVYHSVTTLLTDGTVLSTGGGTPGPVINRNAEIYYPPYLFEEVNGSSRLAQRPIIKAVSGLGYEFNDDLQLDMDSEQPIQQLVLVGLSNSTHSFNSGQRRIPLEFSQQRFRLTTQVPDANLTPPGYYQLVAIDGNGVPSKAVIIGIGQGQTPPAVEVTPYEPPVLQQPIETPQIFANQPVTYGVESEPGTLYSWTFSDTGEPTPYSANSQVQHTYRAPGLYIVTLNAQSADGAVSTKSIVQAVSTARTQLQPATSSQMAYETRESGADRVWVVNPDNNSVAAVNARVNKRMLEIPVGASPRALAFAPGGDLWVTNKDGHSISVIDTDQLKRVDTLSLPRGSQPHGLVFSPDDRYAYVVLEATGEVAKLNVSNGQVLQRLAVGPNPRGVAITADGRGLLVSRFITPPLPGESSADVDLNGGGAEVVVVDANNMAIYRTITLGHSALSDTDQQGAGIPNYLSAAAISPDGRDAWIASKQDNIGRGMMRNGQPLNFENTVRAIASFVSLDNLVENLDMRVDFDDSSVGSAALYHSNGVYLFVALETSREVAVMNALNGTELFRIAVGLAPQGLALSDDGLTLYVKEFMGRSVSTVDLKPLINSGQLSAPVIANTNTVTKEVLSAQVKSGKQLFYDAKDPRLARDSYMSCASCHNDGGQDGRVWDMSDLGEGLRNTISLKGRGGMKHGMLHWSANFDEVQDFEQQIRELSGGTGLMQDRDYFAGSRSEPLGDAKAGISSDLDNLASYVASLKRVSPSPFRQSDGQLTGLAETGKTLFAQQCQDCHGGAAFTRSSSGEPVKDVGTLTQASGNRLGQALYGIDIPSLRNAWATGPYLHDGSAQTIRTAIEAHEGMEATSDQLDALVAYVRQIGSDELGSGLFPIARWAFNEGSGRVVVDESENQNPLSLRYVAWRQDRSSYVGKFNGLFSVASSRGPVVDTSESFSVSAWVKMDHTLSWQSFVNQDSDLQSGFWLHYGSLLSRRFAFSMPVSKNVGSNVVRAVSQTRPVSGRWYHLIGVRDVEAGTIKLYVNGKLEGTAQYNGRWQAQGNLNVGRGRWWTANDYAAGSIDDVSIYDYALTDEDALLLNENDKPD